MSGVRLAELTTLRVGGPADTLVAATSREEIVEHVRAADAAREPLLVLGGGSNLLIDDAGWRGTVLGMGTSGVTVGEPTGAGGGRLVTVQAGHDWDAVVAQTVEEGLSGLEALSGIPGSAGATPVQNVGAYGADVSQTLVRVTVFDRATDQVKELSVGDLRMGYRDSLLKRSTENGSPRYVVLDATFQLFADEDRPVAFAQLAQALGVSVGDRVPAPQVREAVLALRASKGMVLDRHDPDTYSCGSFFTNPVVSPALAQTLPQDAPRFPVQESEGLKLSAAWLIDHAGFHKGFGLPGMPGEALAGGRASLSTKHTLALTNRGQASSADVLAVARAVRDGVKDAWGIELHHEPLLINCTL
ncbi:UDP-N-acetylmuramate dehydrogenase [Galactobacter caseinivorans]|uniref:UDP-N-acetylenolpyruvoylglucosamine reductase n=1 Tax=Galactobacter caseinivorans TaxID=2676123 RepID=A0A496PLU6_9MICC|nr:UDP-N-acetylmuramate dehydrogenase [Galactobacter caseinivorans]RKW71436.1 UDP-N-acetylmuramate dehydrogenase [Galactobacter caseinivorans]